MIKLSIITPYYESLEEISKLRECLEKQLTDSVEWIIIDDGCSEYELDNYKANVVHIKENSGGASVPRNIGIELSRGRYITFIDSDDLISEDYVEKIINKIDETYFDYCMFSWESSDGVLKVEIENEAPEWNCSVWNCVYNIERIKNIRFRKDLKKAEDYCFNVSARVGKRENIKDILYYYKTSEKNTLGKQRETYNDRYI